MCAPTTTTNNDNITTTKHVVVVGAGPAGLLLCNLLLYRNNQKNTATTTGPQRRTIYKVTLIDSRIDVGMLDVETELQQYRSWMIGLAGHGLEAIRSVPGLYEKYVSQKHVGVQIDEFGLFLGKMKMSTTIDESNKVDQEGHVVDRNFVVAAMAKYMDEQHGNDELLTRRYETTLQYVDSDNRRVLVRSNDDNETTKEEYLDYDLLVGADGARSVVRDAFVRDVYDFEADFGDIFNAFRAVHVEKPPGLNPSAVYLLPEVFPKMTGILLPMPGGAMSNISIGVPRNNFDKIAPELKSKDVRVVSDYIRKNFKAFELADYDDFARKWIANCRWNRTAMVHCNTYHNTKAQALLMGDAAHATSPSIGMGMNTALRDAQKFAELLQEYDDDLDKVLPEYSRRRVPEGNSLTDLAFHLFCLDDRVQLWETLHQVIRSKLHSWFPTLIAEHPQAIIGQPKHSLTEVYQLATRLNVVSKHRPINNKIRQTYFEHQVGMNVTPKSSGYVSLGLAVLGAAVGAGAMLHVMMQRS